MPSALKDTLQRRLIGTVLCHVKADIDISAIHHVIRIVAHYVLYAMATAHLLDIANVQFDVQMQVVYVAIAGYTLMASLLIVGLIIVGAWVYGETCFGDKVPWVVYISVRLQLFYKDFMFMQFVLVLVSASTGSQIQFVRFWVIAPITAVFLVLITGFILIYMKNTIPSDTLTAVRHQGGDMLGFLLKIATACLGVASQHQTDARVKVAMQAIVLLFNVAISVYYTVTCVFWSSRTCMITIRSMYWISILSLWCLLRMIGVPGKLLVAGILLALVFAEKLAQNTIMLATMIDCFDKKISKARKLEGIIKLEQVISGKILGNLNSEDEPLYYFYRGLIFKYFNEKGTPELSGIVCSQLQELHKFLVRQLDLNSREVSSIKIAIRFQMLNLFDNLPKIRNMVIRLDELTKANLRQRIEYFHCISMLEAKLRGYYDLKGDAVHTRLNSLKSQYYEILCLSRQEVSREYLNINQPLECKSLFLSFTEDIKKTIEKKRRLFEYLSELTDTSKPEGIILLRMNRKLKKTVNSIDILIADKVAHLSLKPIYYYSSLFIFYSTLKYDFTKSKKLRKQCKEDITIWRSLMAKPPSKSLRVLDSNAVVLQVSVETQKLGKIVEASVNAEAELCAAEGTQVIGMNVNDLFIDALTDKHMELMRSEKNGISSILNIKKRFFIKNFSGELKEISFILRVLPFVQIDLRMVTALTMIKNRNRHFVLMSDVFGLMGAETEFWQKIGKSKSKKKLLESIEILIPRIPLIYNLLKNFRKLKTGLSLLKSRITSGSPLQKIMECLENLELLNGDNKLVYRPADNYYFGSKLESTALICKLEPFYFKEKELVKMYVEFTVDDNPRFTTDHTQISRSQLFFLRSGMAAKVNTSLLNLNQVTTVQEGGSQDQLNTGISTDVDYLLISLREAFNEVNENGLDFCGDDTKEPLVNIYRIVKEFEESFMKELTAIQTRTLAVTTAINPDLRAGTSVFKNAQAEIFVEEMPDAVMQETMEKQSRIALSSKEIKAFGALEDKAVDNLIQMQKERVDSPTYYKGKLMANSINTPTFKKKKKGDNTKKSKWHKPIITDEAPAQAPKRRPLRSIVQSIIGFSRLSRVKIFNLAFQ
jgi:hypothetical protein